MSARPIYHIVPSSEIRSGVRDRVYTAVRFAEDGFVHCAAGRETVIAVANDYYATVAEPVMLLEIDTHCLTAPWRFEPAAPIHGGGLQTADEFPHVYGLVNLDSISGIGTLGPGDGSFGWPSGFVDIDAFLRAASD